jgi:hypothetical protein
MALYRQTKIIVANNRPQARMWLEDHDEDWKKWVIVTPDTHAQRGHHITDNDRVVIAGDMDENDEWWKAIRATLISMGWRPEEEKV